MAGLVKTLVTLALAAAFAVLVTSPAQAEATKTRRVFSYPVEFTTFEPCLNGGEGESVALSGTAQFVYVSTTDPTGAQHIEELTINQQISGVGLTNGDVCRLAGVHRSGFNARYGSFPGKFERIGRPLHPRVHIFESAIEPGPHRRPAARNDAAPEPFPHRLRP